MIALSHRGEDHPYPASRRAWVHIRCNVLRQHLYQNIFARLLLTFFPLILRFRILVISSYYPEMNSFLGFSSYRIAQAFAVQLWKGHAFMGCPGSACVVFFPIIDQHLYIRIGQFNAAGTCLRVSSNQMAGSMSLLDDAVTTICLLTPEAWSIFAPIETTPRACLFPG